MSILNGAFIAKDLKKDLLVIIILVTLPFAFFTHRLFPETQAWTNTWFVFDSGYFEDVKYFVWTMMAKLLTLSLLSIWFLTSKHSWRYILFIPIIAEIHKIYTWFKCIEFGFHFISEVYETFVFSIPYLIFIYYVSNVLGYYKKSKKYSSKILNNEINNQIVKLSRFDSKNYKKVKKELIYLINNKKNMTNREYLSKLIALRDRIAV